MDLGSSWETLMYSHHDLLQQPEEQKTLCALPTQGNMIDPSSDGILSAYDSSALWVLGTTPNENPLY